MDWILPQCSMIYHTIYPCLGASGNILSAQFDRVEKRNREIKIMTIIKCQHGSNVVCVSKEEMQVPDTGK